MEMKKSICLVFAIAALLLVSALPGRAWEHSVVIEQQPPLYAQAGPQQEEQDFLYYCPDARGYYPDVKQCPGGWLKVVPPPSDQGVTNPPPPAPSIPPDRETYGPPPIYTMPAAPAVVVIPGTYVYAVPDVNVPILFYQGFWWRPFEGRWYRAKFYNGPWVYVGRRMVPGALLALPPDYYLHIPLGLSRIPYAELRDNWERWERDRYWDRARERHEERDERRERERHY